MGAGNPIIRSYDEELYSPITYYLDFTGNYTEESKLEAIKEYYEANELEGFEDLTEDEIQNEFYELIEFDVENFQNEYFFNLDEKYEDLWDNPDDNEKCIDELSASFRGSAVVLAMNDDCLVLTTTESQLHHYPIALVPNFKLEDIVEDYYYDNQNKEKWYNARNFDFEERCQEMGKKIYEKKLSKWIETYEPFMKYFYNNWRNCLSVRSGPWTSLGLYQIGDDYEFL